MTQLKLTCPCLDGLSVALRPMKREYLEMGLVDWLNDLEVVRLSNQRFVSHNIDTCIAYLESMASNSNIYLGIFEASTLRLVGTVTAVVNVHHMTADIGILVGQKEAWGKGYGGEAFMLISDYLQDELKLRKLTCGTLACNYGMLKVIKKAGFIPDGVRKQQELICGSPVDVHYFAKFLDE